MRRERAFTLVEVTVAIAVTMILVSLLLQVLTQSSIIWSRSNESLDTFREARAALQLMGREIGRVRPVAAYDPNDPKKGPDYPLLALKRHPESEESSDHLQEIYALLGTPNSGKADWCAVGYFCRWNDTRKAYSLARQFTRSDTTYNNLAKVLSNTAPLSGSTAFTTLYGRPAVDSTAGSVDDVATFFWDLQFVLPDNLVLGDGQKQQWEHGTFCQKLPAWIEVRCKALGSLAARRLQAQAVTPETWLDEKSTIYQRSILPYQQQFITRISLAQ